MTYLLDQDDIWHIALPFESGSNKARCNKKTVAMHRSTDLVFVERSKLPWCAACDATLW
jgi:hypothetical protein